MRKLATIQVIHNILPIEGADRIVLACILGWQCVVKKDEFKIGDKCVYFEVDSFLPIDPRFEFLRSSSYKKNDIMGEGFRIKTQKFRGSISQGLCLPISVFPEITTTEVGTDVSELLNVVKWEMPEMTGNAGTIVGDKPFFIHTTDEMRVQTIDNLRKQLLGKPYYISTKMDGTSCSMYFRDGKFGVCGRKSEYKDDGKSTMWAYAYKNDIMGRLQKYGKDIVLQGEFVGPGIQKNRLKLKDFKWYIFNVMLLNPDGNYRIVGLDDMVKIVSELGLYTVPIEEVGDNFNYTLPELLARANGNYDSGMKKEGIVIRPVNPEFSKDLSSFLSFKVLNNEFLLKE